MCIPSSWQAIYNLAATTLGVDPSRYCMNIRANIMYDATVINLMGGFT